MSMRWKRVWLFLLLHFGISFGLLIPSFSPEVRAAHEVHWGVIGCPYFVFGVPVSRWLSHVLTVLFVRTLRCRRCGVRLPAVNLWQIGSFTDYRERHILRVKDPSTGKRIGMFPCPQCGSTILV